MRLEDRRRSPFSGRDRQREGFRIRSASTWGVSIFLSILTIVSAPWAPAEGRADLECVTVHGAEETGTGPCFRSTSLGPRMDPLAEKCTIPRPPRERLLQCTPRMFRVVPGEPIRLELTVQTDSAAPIRLHVPGDPLLKLRALEKLPVRRTPEGVIVHKRVVVWQGLEPGTVEIKTLSVETGGQKLLFPEVTVTIRDPGP